jgi:hypothetical protein
VSGTESSESIKQAREGEEAGRERRFSISKSPSETDDTKEREGESSHLATVDKNIPNLALEPGDAAHSLEQNHFETASTPARELLRFDEGRAFGPV